MNKTMLYAIISDISQRSSTMDAAANKAAASDTTSAQKKGGVPARAPSRDLDLSSCSDSEGSDAAASPSESAATDHMPSGLILKSGRVRLPDRLMEYLNKEVAPEALYWMPEGESFAFDTEKAPEQILSKFFSGTKLTSFLRSISRWGFKRVFYHDLQRHVYAFHHPLFKKSSPHLEKEMKMVVSTSSQSRKAKTKGKGKTDPSQALSTERTVPVAGISSPTVSTREHPSIMSPTAARPLVPAALSTLTQPGLAQTIPSLSLSTLTAQAPAMTALRDNFLQAQAPAASTTVGDNFLQAQQLLQQQQQPPAQQPSIQQVPSLRLMGLLQRLEANLQALSQLLALQGAAGAGGSSSTPQEGLVRLAMARQQLQQLQQQQQQQQQQQAVLDLLNALQRRNQQG